MGVERSVCYGSCDGYESGCGFEVVAVSALGVSDFVRHAWRFPSLSD